MYNDKGVTMTSHAAQRGSRDITLLLNLGTRWGMGDDCHTLCMERAPLPILQVAGWAHDWSGQVGEEKSCCAHLG